MNKASTPAATNGAGVDREERNDGSTLVLICACCSRGLFKDGHLCPWQWQRKAA